MRMSQQTHGTTPSYAESVVPTANVKTWSETIRLKVQRCSNNVPQGSEREYFDAVTQFLRTMESAIVSGTSESVARQEFITWVDEDYNRENALRRYIEERDRLEKEEQRLATERAHERLKDRARDEAVKLRNGYRGGLSDSTVVCGLVDLASGTVWTAVSGTQYPHHTVLTELLRRTHQVETWPVEACAEVNALNQYLNSQGITNKSDISSDTLFFHAETWNSGKNQWQARSACKNCSQWFDKIKAGRC